MGVLLLTLGLLTYIAYQARFLLIGPQITITDASQGTVGERVVTIEGTVRNIARISLNGKQIYTDPEGFFREAVVLGTGYNLITIAATDRYGRSTTVKHEYVYEQELTSLVQ